MDVTEDEAFALPDGVPACAVLVLGGSSGQVEAGRVARLAAHGAAALSIRWFGGEGQPPGICEVPLESLEVALRRLDAYSDRLAVLGTSKGAEAALLLAVRNPRVALVGAFSPTSVVWANVGPGLDGVTSPYRSCWTADGRPLPFVPYDDDWEPAEDPPSFLGLYERSLARYPDAARAAVIPVERIPADVLLAAGGDDRVWPSRRFVREIATRRAENGLSTRTVVVPGAGHRMALPGEAPVAAGRQAMVRGGTPQADARLGALVWEQLQGLLGLSPAPGGAA